MGLRIEGRIEKVNGKELSYSDFAEKYLAPNQPVILSGLTEDWRACKDWVKPDGTPHLRFFSAHFGNSNVQVADCGTKEFTDQRGVEMSVSDFIERWALLRSSKGCCGEGQCKSLLYLKDWHFVREYPDYCAYKTPLFFCDDWLNTYLDRYRMQSNDCTYQEQNEISCSDYRFVYMGPKGTWTPLHADVFRSYSWSANICGKKQWFLLPPNQSHLLFDRNMKNSVYDILEEVDEIEYPGFKKARWLECIQEQNEIIFVPSGWYHQVHNLEDTISINHNWYNAYNTSWVWDLLSRDYEEARDYIEDIRDICDDFEGLCQRNLAANTGMNFWDFFIFQARCANFLQLHYLIEGGTDGSRLLSQRALHLIFNLKSIQSICRKMRSVGLTEIRGAVSNLMGKMEKNAFLELCIALEETYMAMYDQLEISSANAPTSFNYADENLHGLINAQVCSPEDLVHFVDMAFAKLSLDPDIILSSRKEL